MDGVECMVYRVFNDNVVYVRGFYRVDSIDADTLFVDGFIEVRRRISVDKLFVIGGVKARSMQANKVLIILKTNSTVLDIEADRLRVVRRGYGRLCIDRLYCRECYLTWTLVHRLCCKKLVVRENVIVENIVCNGEELVVRSPYIVFRDNASSYYKRIHFLYNTYR